MPQNTSTAISEKLEIVIQTIKSSSDHQSKVSAMIQGLETIVAAGYIPPHFL